MASLRQRLQSEAPELYAALLRSWEIAQKEWLPAVAPSEGSYNSLPHFRNVEYHLESLLGAAADSPYTKLRLSTLDVYLLLAAVLFHDFGRVHGDEGHAKASAKALLKDFVWLGIPSIELASSLSRISHYHDAKKAEIDAVKRTLRHVRIEPFGTATELSVATLLALADHMDASTRRAMPYYVKPDEEVGFKGAFRRLISGTGYDPATFTIKTTLNGFDEGPDEPPPQFDFPKLYSKFACHDHILSDEDEASARPNIPKNDRGPDQAAEPCVLFDRIVNACSSRPVCDKPSGIFRKCVRALCGDAQYYLTRAIDKRTKRPFKALWPADYLIAVVLNDLDANRNKFFKHIKRDLDEMALPIDDWFIEFESEVFDERGAPPPGLVPSGDLLLRVAKEMWRLRCRMLDRGFMSYELLADSLREENVSLVRLAAQRLARRANREAVQIGAGTSGWTFDSTLESEKDLDQELRNDVLGHNTAKSESAPDGRSAPA